MMFFQRANSFDESDKEQQTKLSNRPNIGSVYSFFNGALCTLYRRDLFFLRRNCKYQRSERVMSFGGVIDGERKRSERYESRALR